MSKCHHDSVLTILADQAVSRDPYTGNITRVGNDTGPFREHPCGDIEKINH
jgi:hypothetical protein